MSYDEPPEPTEEEIAEYEAREATENAPVRIEGLTLAAVVSVIRGILESNYGLGERINEAVDKLVARRVGELLDETIRARVANAIDAGIAEGFGIFDSYSGRERERTTLGALVRKLLDTKNDDYGRKSTLVDIAIKKAVDELFEKELKAEMEKVKADLRKQADGVFQAKLVAGMREALGLR